MVSASAERKSSVGSKVVKISDGSSFSCEMSSSVSCITTISTPSSFPGGRRRPPERTTSAVPLAVELREILVKFRVDTSTGSLKVSSKMSSCRFKV